MYTKRKDERIVAIIPARGGSKGIPKKNLKLLGGKPLIAWPIELALSIKRISRVIVSTDDNEIMLAARKYGAEVPFKRPAKLSDDKTPTLPVLQHAIRFLEKEGYKPDIILLLTATNPFLRKERVIQALERFDSTGCNSVLGVKKVKGIIWKYNESRSKYAPYYPLKRVNRQFFKSLYEEAGNIFYSRYTVLMNLDRVVDENNIEFIFVDDDEQLDIDTASDLKKARTLLRIKSL